MIYKAPTSIKNQGAIDDVDGFFLCGPFSEKTPV